MRHTVPAKVVFIGAGGGAIELLQKSRIPEDHGYGGFPVSGVWLRCDDAGVSNRHHAKVYGKAARGSPPMSVPLLDTRIIDGKKSLLFGLYAGELKPQVFLCTDLHAEPVDILRWFVRRWSVEVTFAAVRRHLSVETQRQWSDPAIARTTPALLGLFSLVALWPHDLYATRVPTARTTSWYVKSLPTFSDALALVRRELWTHHDFHMSLSRRRCARIPKTTLDSLKNAAC